MKKTLGGDRLGTGAKMSIEMRNYERSTHDKGFVFRTTMSAGTLVPFMKELALPGDTFDLDLNCDVKTHPTVGPLFGSYKVQLDIFQCPIRLYHAWLHNNKLNIGLDMSKVKLPLVKMVPFGNLGADPNKYDVDNYQINPSAIFSYLGIRGVGTYSGISAAPDRFFNTVPWLAYWDIYKNYYANKQEEIGAVIHNGSPAVDHKTNQIEYPKGGNIIPDFGTGAGPAILLNPTDLLDITNSGAYQDPANIMLYISTAFPQSGPNWVPLLSLFGGENIVGTEQFYSYNGTTGAGSKYLYQWAYSDEVSTPEINITTFPLENIDLMRELILLHTTYPAPFVIQESDNLSPYSLALKTGLSTGFNSMQSTQEGLAIKTYQSDLFNNWLSTEWIDGTDGISQITAVDVSGGSFTIDTLQLSKKVYDMLNRIAVSGGSYDDWLDTVYTSERFTRASTPIYQGGLIKELTFQEVVSVGADTSQPLGTLAGKGTMTGKHKGGKISIKVDEPSYIIGLVSITPRIDYSQGNDWDIHLETMDDLHKPALDEIGFQELITERLAWWDTNYDTTTNTWVTKSAGKQPAWIEYMTSVNKVLGNFAIKNNEMFMTLNRRYEADIDTGTGYTTIKDLTTYIDPRIYNQIFAETALDSQNFWVQIGIDDRARRKMSAKLMPNL